MFGYIIAEKSELRIKEYDMYKAVYCSLCKTLGKKYGVISRFTLSYDFTFLGLLLGKFLSKKSTSMVERLSKFESVYINNPPFKIKF